MPGDKKGPMKGGKDGKDEDRYGFSCLVTRTTGNHFHYTISLSENKSVASV